MMNKSFKVFFSTHLRKRRLIHSSCQTLAEKRPIQEIYQKKSLLSHILTRPDLYIGTTERISNNQYVYCRKKNKIVEKTICYSPGLFKIFDEIIVNASDNKQRDDDIRKMDSIKIDIDATEGEIKVWNNGRSIPIEIHKTENIYIPEMIFGHLLTSSNYDDRQKRITGGKNGFGAKLTNIYSSTFDVEVYDATSGCVFKQKFKKNMTEKGQPIITKKKNKHSYTCITFQPDIKRFGGSRGFDNEIMSLFEKRIYDLAATLTDVKIKYNGIVIPMKKGFSQYIHMYAEGPKPPLDIDATNENSKNDADNIDNNDNDNDPVKENSQPESPAPPVVIHEIVNKRWEIGVMMSPDETFRQVSFVNGICTVKGGTHVNTLIDGIVKKLNEAIAKKNKDAVLNKMQARNYIWLFVNSKIENPTFETQTKETLTTTKKDFGSNCPISEKFIKSILTKTSILAKIESAAKSQNKKDLQKKSGKKLFSLLNVPKLDDANKAGGKHSRDCTLILTEGDSAKTLAVSGVSCLPSGREYYGIFPLKGKLLNVRQATHKQISSNAEIKNLVKILGLQFNKKYNEENISELRYGSILIMTDADVDGSHIKGLILNLFHHYWPSLLYLERPFLVGFLTPVIKATKKKESKAFFSIAEYEDWKKSNDPSAWFIKYYKGLGTSTSKEAQYYFSNLLTHQSAFKFSNQPHQDNDRIDLVFSKDRSDERKTWLTEYVPQSLNKINDQNDTNDHDNSRSSSHNVDAVTAQSQTFKDFIDKEFILFSMADNIRSIPNVIDGFKPGQRKVLFGCMKRKLTNEIKVSQLAGYISEQTAYHHGEASLTGTIISMAQNFVGSNNINLLTPIGSFGTRLLGGKDNASPRYINTKLSSLTSKIFLEQDNPVLNYLDEDGQAIEPELFAPIIPMVLVNGAEGIGTGWSTQVLKYNAKDIIRILLQKLKSKTDDPVDKDLSASLQLQPCYTGFDGKITQTQGNSHQFVCQGIIKTSGSRGLEISELPIRVWTQSYKELLQKELLEKNVISGFKEYHTEEQVRFILKYDVSSPLNSLVPLLQLPKKSKASSFSSSSSSSLISDSRIAETKIIKLLKLESTLSSSNMMLFNAQGKIQKYDSVAEILDEFYVFRLSIYKKRKNYLLSKLKHEIRILESKIRFLSEIVNSRLSFKEKSQQAILQLLLDQGYYRNTFNSNIIESSNVGRDMDTSIDVNDASGFNYLINMPIVNFSQDKISLLEKQYQEKSEKRETLKRSDVKDLWISDLNNLLLLLEREP